MKKKVTFEMLEEINETHGSAQNTQMNENEHKLISKFSFEGFFSCLRSINATSTFGFYILSDIADPFIEMSDIPPNSLS